MLKQKTNNKRLFINQVSNKRNRIRIYIVVSNPSELATSNC